MGALAVTAIGTGGLLAKYRTDRIQEAEMISAQFHMTSDYLEEDGKNIDNTDAVYDITDWSSGFDILLYNYEKENLALIAADEIQYDVSITSNGTDGWGYTDSGDGHLNQSQNRISETLHIIPGQQAETGDRVTVTVTTTAPFKKVLKATFIAKDSNLPKYTIKDQADGTVLLTIKTEAYSGQVTIRWNKDDFDPDSNNPLMKTWKDSTQMSSIPVEKNSTYTLLFFKNTAADVSETSGSGTDISL